MCTLTGEHQAMTTSCALLRKPEIALISNGMSRRLLNALCFTEYPYILAEALKTARSALKYRTQKAGILDEDVDLRDNSRLAALSLAAIHRVDSTYQAAIDCDAPLNADLLTTGDLRDLVHQKKKGLCSGKRKLEQAKWVGRKTANCEPLILYSTPTPAPLIPDVNVFLSSWPISRLEPSICKTYVYNTTAPRYKRAISQRIYC